jgi:murein DD-endopeptidase MepM/ murein hydrolase activator NlpD
MRSFRLKPNSLLPRASAINRLLLCLFAFALLASLLASCQRMERTAEQATVEAATHAVETVAPLSTYSQAVAGLTPTAPGAPQLIPQPDAESTPLRFTFPTPGPAPISLWRPPLYETPWALGPNDHFYFARPIAADEVNWPLADYRYGGIFFSSEIVHTGIDIPTPRNTPILAAGNGRVVWAGYGLFSGGNDPDDPYGLAVTIRHDFGYQGQRLYTVYAHMERVDVTTGQEVKTGDQLGVVGTTGLTTGPHLHFEVRTERNSYFTTLNPELWLAPPQGWGVLAGTLLNTNGSLLTQHDVMVRNKETRQRWGVRSYGASAVNSDPYYRENLVLSDLPAGLYEITIEYLEETYRQEITIQPGAISYFSFRGKLSFDTALPPTPSIDEMITGWENP